MDARIYLLNDSNSTLLPMKEQPYDSERLLQELLAKYPDLLAGEQINSNAPRRWLLVTREMAVPGEQDGMGRWSLDHLFLDQDAVPTLVEVKRSSDTRIRREVIGQMLDYAANAVAFWPVEEIQTKFESRCDGEGLNPDEELTALLEGEDISGFWQHVKTNLQAGRIRMIFIADTIPSELRQIVEFLNRQMDPAEVLAIEVKQFLGEGMKTLVPRVMGQTEAALDRKNPDRRKKWDEELFFEDLRQRRGVKEVAVARRLLEWANAHSLRIWWGEGSNDGSFFPMYDNRFGKNFLFSVRSPGRVEIQFQHMKTPFDGAQKRREVAQRLSAIEGILISDESLTGKPKVPLALLVEPAALESFLHTFDWMLSEIRKVENAEAPLGVAPN